MPASKKNSLFIILIIFTSVSLFAQKNEVYYNTFYSKILGSNSSYGVFENIHSSQDTLKIPLIILLHGLGGDYKSFFYKGLDQDIDSVNAVSTLPDFILITPNGHKSYFIDSYNEDYKWEAMFVNELLPELIHEFPVDTEKIIISGFSMGGYGALNLIFKSWC